jgi:hypothetical protein
MCGQGPETPTCHGLVQQSHGPFYLNYTKSVGFAFRGNLQKTATGMVTILLAVVTEETRCKIIMMIWRAWDLGNDIMHD